MAIRFKANIQAVRLSEITLVDRARMPLTPSAAIHLEVHPHVVHLSEIALVKSAQMLNSGIQYQRMMLAESVYEKMVAAGIWTDADSKNRILPDIFNIVETFSIALARSTDDQLTIADAAFLTLSKLATDSATTTDSLSMWFGLSNADSATLAEAIAISLSHSYADYSALADTTILQVAKTKSEVTAVSDTVVHVSNFYRNFIDAVTLSEFVTVDRVIDAFNAAAAVDAHYWATSKPVEDAAVIADITKLATTRLVTDGLSSSDFSSWTYAKELLDTALLVEATYLSLTKMATDTSILLDQSALHSEKPLVENATVSDTVIRSTQFDRTFLDYVALDDITNGVEFVDATKHNVATLRDVAAIGVTTPYSDSAFIQEAHEYSVGKFFTEYMGTSDVISISIQRPNNLTPVFNGITFNTSTFG